MKNKFSGANWISIRAGQRLPLDADLLEYIEKNDVKKYYRPYSLLLRDTFNITKQVKKAVIRIAGVGFYHAYINGHRIKDTALGPATTDYRQIVLYDKVDVTGLIQKEGNCIVIELGNGRYSFNPKYWGWKGCFFGSPRAIAQLIISYQDGSEDIISTGPGWKIKRGAVTSNCIYDGMTLDLRLQDKDLHNPKMDESGWKNAEVVEAPCKELVPNRMPDIRACGENQAIKRIKTGPLTETFCFEYNCTGWTAIKVKGSSGARVTVKYAEKINEDFTLDTKSNRGALNTDCFILSSDDKVWLEPRFTYRGFRYASCEVSDPGVIVLNAVQKHVHSDVKQTGSFTCDNRLINKIHNAYLLTQKNALLGVPLDCTQRDERLGWLGDAYVTCESCMYNFDMLSFYDKWLRDIRLDCNPQTGDIHHIAPWPQGGDVNSPDFSIGFLIIALKYYQHYASKSAIKLNFDAFENYIRHLVDISDDYILPKSRYGDWKSAVKGFERGDPYYCNTVYLYYCVVLVKRFCNILQNGKENYYDNLAENIKTKLIELYYNPSKKQFGDATQFSNALALTAGLIPEQDVDSVFNNLVADITTLNNTHLTTGIFGTWMVMELLRQFDKKDLAFSLMTQKTYPSWLNMLENNTTLTENWNGSEASLNHCMFGSVDAQFYKILGGINLDSLAEQYITISPYFTRECGHVKAKVHTQYGDVLSEWKREDDSIKLTVSLPEGVKSRIYIPELPFDRILEGGMYTFTFTM